MTAFGSGLLDLPPQEDDRMKRERPKMVSLDNWDDERVPVRQWLLPDGQVEQVEINEQTAVELKQAVDAIIRDAIMKIRIH